MPPRKVMLVRHAEKLGDPSRDDLGGINLSVRGFARAAALPTLFVPAARAIGCPVSLAGGTVQATFEAAALAGAAPRFETPDVIFATRDSNHSCRPRQTAIPTAAALGCPFDCTTYTHEPQDASQLGADLLRGEDFAGRVVLVFWHHGTIPAVAAALGITPAPNWAGDDVFDRVWTIAFGAAASLTEDRQGLLFGDA